MCEASRVSREERNRKATRSITLKTTARSIPCNVGSACTRLERDADVITDTEGMSHAGTGDRPTWCTAVASRHVSAHGIANQTVALSLPKQVSKVGIPPMGIINRIHPRALPCALAVVLALSPAVGTAAEQTQPVGSTAIAPTVRIDNFGRVNAGYYRGAQPEGRGYADLKSLGIKTVIDLQKDFKASEQRLVQSAGMKFYRIPMTTRVAPTKEQLESFLQIVNDPANQPVYVHCAGGRHRTGVMTAVYRMTHDGWSGEQAFKEMKDYDFGADFLHPEFKQFVYAYKVDPVGPVRTVLATSVIDSVPAR
jgi:tyrosine-protein phosphatase SIW14